MTAEPPQKNTCSNPVEEAASSIVQMHLLLPNQVIELQVRPCSCSATAEEHTFHLYSRSYEFQVQIEAPSNTKLNCRIIWNTLSLGTSGVFFSCCKSMQRDKCQCPAFFRGRFLLSIHVYILFRQSSPLQVPFHTLDLLLSLIPALSLSLTPLASLPFPGPSVLPTSFSFLLQAFLTC